MLGDDLDILLDAAGRRWKAQPHAAAALAWKAYTYWLALPAVLGWASARRVPLLTGANVLMHFDDPRPLVTLGLRADIPVAVLPTDPLALSGHPQVRVVADEDALLAEFRRTLLDEHLAAAARGDPRQGPPGQAHAAGLPVVGRGLRRAALGGCAAGPFGGDDRPLADRARAWRT